MHSRQAAYLGFWEHSLDGSAESGLGHLQGQPHHQLHQRVEHDVLHVDVDKLVGQEPPDLVPPQQLVIAVKKSDDVKVRSSHKKDLSPETEMISHSSDIVLTRHS